MKMESKKRKRDNDEDESTIADAARKRPFISTFRFNIDKIIWDSKLLDYIRNHILIQEKEDVHKWIALSIQDEVYKQEDIQYKIGSLISLLNQFLPDFENERYIITQYCELVESIEDSELLDYIKVISKYEPFIHKINLIDGKNGNLTKFEANICDNYDEQAQKFVDLYLESQNHFNQEQDKQKSKECIPEKIR